MKYFLLLAMVIVGCAPAATPEPARVIGAPANEVVIAISTAATNVRPSFGFQTYRVRAIEGTTVRLVADSAVPTADSSIEVTCFVGNRGDGTSEAQCSPGRYAGRILDAAEAYLGQ